MKKSILLIIVTVIISGIYIPLKAQTIDTSLSVVNFKISNMKINNVKGTFKGMSGDIKFNKEDLTTAYFDVCVDAATIKSGINLRDEHLRDENFFDVSKYPQICFVSEKVFKEGEQYFTSGELTMKGVSNPVKIPFTFDGKRFSGSFVVNRLDYNVGVNTGTFMAANEVELSIECILK